jgi:dethiobiotin synthetase
MSNYFITAIGTDSGKTITSAVFCEALNADYWKPIQAGFPRDSDVIKDLISNAKTVIHPEKYLLETPASPHAAAKLQNIEIAVKDFELPVSRNHLIIEGAGGCLVPINDREFVIDLVTHLKVEVILVANLYLGSINHTLLTIEALKNRNIKVKGIVFNGEPNAESERIILYHSKFEKLLSLGKKERIDRNFIKQHAETLKEKLHV